MAEARISALAASGVCGMIGRYGGDAERVAGAARLQLDRLRDPAALLELRDYCELFEQAARQTEVESFGLRFGCGYQPEDMGPLGLLTVNAPTLGQALHNLCRYFPAMQEHSTLRLLVGPHMAALEYQIRDGRIAQRRQDAELSIGIFNNIFRRCFGPGWSPAEIHFEHLRAGDTAEYQRLLNAPVYFGAAKNAILFRRDAMGATMPGHRPQLLPLLRDELSRRAAAARPDDFIGPLVQEIRLGFIAGDASIGRIAERLGMSRASLYRRLAAAGSEFSALTRSVREDLALMYTAQPDLPFTDISALLGYSELSAFSRAFRRWTGLSPAAYRQRMI